ncbi:hypothetical protein QBC37DRAFT_451789 [Rhypophila decipiens]|uniref:Uncharacterized protein n=1 Tax=Rhypophila decipiens TaxID=261697 RepID=A0AAN6Y083_9PEZI|nr:hypothetical protein QBC37DRAFT_451789 [Rhypophila decipiens]
MPSGTFGSSQENGEQDSPKLDAYLGIDLASVATRAVLSWRDEEDKLQEPIIVRNKNPGFNQSDKREDQVEFPSDCSVDGKSVLLHPDLPADTLISGKYLIYILGKAEGKLRDEFPLFAELRCRVTPGNAELALHQHFQGLIARVEEVCKAKRLIIRTVTITVPAHWPTELVGVYETVVRESFDAQYNTVDNQMPNPRVQSCFESQAIGRCILAGGSKDLHNEIKYSPDIVAMIDCGGHSASSSIFAASRDQGKGLYSFFDMQSSEGVGGGCEQFLRDSSLWCTSELLESMEDSESVVEKGRLAGDIRSKFDRVFLSRIKKCATDDEFFRDFRFSYQHETNGGSPSKTVNVELAGSSLREFWEIAVKEVKTMAQQQFQAVKDHISDLAKHLGSAKPLIIVSGGTARTPPLRSFLEEQCKGYGFEGRLFFAEDLDSVTVTTTTIARGASEIGASRGTVPEFIEAGPASIAVQVRQAGAQDWDSSARVVGKGKDFVKDIVLDVEKGDELKLICSPFAQGGGPSQPAGQGKLPVVSVHRGFYDLIPLLPPSPFKQKVHIQLEWLEPDLARVTEGMLQMRISFHTRRQKKGRSETQQAEPAFFFDRTCNCMLPVLREDVYGEDGYVKYTVVYEDDQAGPANRQKKRRTGGVEKTVPTREITRPKKPQPLPQSGSQSKRLLRSGKAIPGPGLPN